jgi:hypothetical protein
VELIKTTGLVSPAVSDHPDMFMCRLGITDESPLISYFDLSDSFLLSPGYPDEVAFNAACTGRFFIHNLRYTCPALLGAAESAGMQTVNVRQGYAKCSTVIVDEDSIITYDRGLAGRCTQAGMDVLLIEPGYIHLEGYNTGFIGGCSGRIGDTIIFNGDLSSHPDFRSIVGFIEDRGLAVKWFQEWELGDIGSII